MDEKPKEESAPEEQLPHRVLLPGWLVKEEVGLGSVIKSVTYRVGIKPCTGCEKRAVALNRRVVFSPRKS